MFMLKRDQEATQQLQYKVIVLGDGAVGKTSLCKRFTEDSFARRCVPASKRASLHSHIHQSSASLPCCSYKQTIGVDFFLKLIQLPGDRSVALQAGQPALSSALQRFVSCNGCTLMFMFGSQMCLQCSLSPSR